MTNVKRYDIDYNKLEVQRIPTDLRCDEMISWVATLCMPFVYLYNQFKAYRTQKLYELAITPQVCYLQKMLNDRYDNEDRRITIVDGLSHDATYDYLVAEEKPSYLYLRSEDVPVYDLLKGEIGEFSYDFVVKVPSAVSFNQNEMTGLLKNYALADRFFTIQIV